MPWYFPWSDNIKKRSCRYLLQRYLGQFLEEKLTLEQLSVDLYNGTGSVCDVTLDVQSLNELGEQQNWPIEFVDGYIKEISVSIPWSALLSDSSTVEVKGLNLVVQPKQRADIGVSMFDSVWSSMTSSIQIAEECLKQTTVDSEQSNPLEGLELFAQTIDSILTRTKLQFSDAIIRLEYLPKESVTGCSLEIHLVRFSYHDGSCSDVVVDKPVAYTPTFSTKYFALEGVSFHTNEFHAVSRTMCRSLVLESSLTQSGNGAGITNQNNLKNTTCSNDLILVGKLIGRQEIKLKIKQVENISGPKVEMEANVTSLAIFVTPRQLRILCDIVYGMVMPHLQDNSNVVNRPRYQKPMSSSDFEKVEQELMQHVSPSAGNVQNTKSLQNTTGWSSGGIVEDSDDDFHPMKGHKAMDSSVSSSAANSVSSSFSSHSSSYQKTEHTTRHSSKHKEKGSITHDPDAGGDVSVYHMKLNSLSVILLHQDILTIGTGTFLPTSASIQEMKQCSEKFFSHISAYLTSGYGHKDFESSKQIFLDAVSQRNHFRLISTTVLFSCEERYDTSVTDVRTSCSMADVEFVECLVSDEKPTQYVELLCFMSSKSSTTTASVPSQPNIFIRSKYATNNKKFSPHHCTELNVNVQPCLMEVDVTLIDRLRDVIYNLKPFFDRYTTSTSTKDSAFQQVVNTTSVDKKLDWKIHSPLVLVKFRFPVPDVSATYNPEECPWWIRDVYDDTLHIELTEVVASSSFSTYQISSSYEVKCASFRGLWQHSRSDNPVLFISSSVNENNNGANKVQDFECSRLILKLYPKVSYTDLEEVLTDTMKHSVMDQMVQESSPFTSKKVMRESDTTHNKCYSGGEGEQIILPGSKEEIADFAEDTSRNARIQVDIAVTSVVVLLPSKHFYEVLYNRISNDLLLWTPKILKPLSSNLTKDSLDITKKGTPLVASFSLCKSAAAYQSESESDDDEETLVQEYSHVTERREYFSSIELNSSNCLQSKVTLSLFVEKGILDVYPHARDSTGNVIPGQFGELQLVFDEASLFLVAGYKGKPNLNYTCLQINHLMLYHSELIPASVGFSICPMNSYPSKHLSATIYKTGPGGAANDSVPLVGCGSASSDDMLTLAIRVNIMDKTIKNICVANSLNGATLRYRPLPPYCSWLMQMLHFFDVTDYPILNYQPMRIVTELHQQFLNCIIDYRPLYLPIKAAVTLENFNISSNITAKTSSSMLRFIAEEVCLFVSNKHTSSKHETGKAENIDLRNDYVCVVDVALFELSLRLTDSEEFPKVDLRASNNILHIRTCSDTAIALMQLIKYVASDGDLRQQTKEDATVSKKQNSTNEVLVDLGDSTQKNTPLVENGNLCSEELDQVPHLMEEAINDTFVLKPTKKNAGKTDDSNIEVFYFPDEQDRYKQQSQQESISSHISSPYSESDDEDLEIGYCFLDQSISRINKIQFPSPKDAAEVHVLTVDPIRVIDNHFSVPTAKTDQLKTPEGYPHPVARYTLREMTVIWHMYAGHDFDQHPAQSTAKRATIVEKPEPSECRLSRQSSLDSIAVTYSAGSTSDLSAVNFSCRRSPCCIEGSGEGSYGSSCSNVLYDKKKTSKWQTQGGAGRQHDVLMELQLTKMRFQHEVYPTQTKHASRQVLLIHDVEIRDRLAASNINKFLYQFNSTSRPRQSNANMVFIRATHLRPEPEKNTAPECALRVSFLPLRLNIDQDSLIFLIKFFSEISGNDKDTLLNANLENVQDQVVQKEDEVFGTSSESPASDSVSSRSLESSPLFIRSFQFAPEVTVRLDYEGKHVDMSHGPVAGLIMGLAKLNCSEIRLKKVINRHGFLGLDKLVSYVLSEWLQDIKKNQLPAILGGVGPMYSIVQLFQGIRDLFWLPIEQYQKDGRIVRGLQRGANSFTTSTAMAALELTSRIVYAIQRIAETAFDIVSPGPSIRYLRLHQDNRNKNERRLRHRKYGQPADIREGVATALLLVREGFGETAQTLVRVASVEHEVKGTVGAVGGVLRQIPSTALTPIILVSQATSSVLGGVKSQLVPDAREETARKWRDDYV